MLVILLLSFIASVFSHSCGNDTESPFVGLRLPLLNLKQNTSGTLVFLDNCNFQLIDFYSAAQWPDGVLQVSSSIVELGQTGRAIGDVPGGEPYSNASLSFTLEDGMEFGKDIRAFSVWCRTFVVDFAHTALPDSATECPPVLGNVVTPVESVEQGREQLQGTFTVNCETVGGATLLLEIVAPTSFERLRATFQAKSNATMVDIVTVKVGADALGSEVVDSFAIDGAEQDDAVNDWRVKSIQKNDDGVSSITLARPFGVVDGEDLQFGYGRLYVDLFGDEDVDGTDFAVSRLASDEPTRLFSGDATIVIVRSTYKTFRGLAYFFVVMSVATCIPTHALAIRTTKRQTDLTLASRNLAATFLSLATGLIAASNVILGKPVIFVVGENLLFAFGLTTLIASILAWIWALGVYNNTDRYMNRHYGPLKLVSTFSGLFAISAIISGSLHLHGTVRPIVALIFGLLWIIIGLAVAPWRAKLAYGEQDERYNDLAIRTLVAGTCVSVLVTINVILEKGELAWILGTGIPLLLIVVAFVATLPRADTAVDLNNI